MIETIQENENYISSFASFETSRASNDPAWLNKLRRSAWDRFLQLGFPTTHDEEWRFTSVAPITKVPFKLAADATDPSSAELASFTFGTWPGIQLVFVNGIYSATLSSNPAQPNGVFAGSLAEALEKQANRVQPHLATLCQRFRGTLCRAEHRLRFRWSFHLSAKGMRGRGTHSSVVSVRWRQKLGTQGLSPSRTGVG